MKHVRDYKTITAASFDAKRHVMGAVLHFNRTENFHGLGNDHVYNDVYDDFCDDDCDDVCDQVSAERVCVTN